MQTLPNAMAHLETEQAEMLKKLPRLPVNVCLLARQVA